MSKLVILDLYGKINIGFNVSLQISEDNGNILNQCRGKLPPNLEIHQVYRKWHLQYLHSITSSRIKLQSVMRFSSADNMEVTDLATQLSQLLNEWLQSKEFFTITNAISTLLDTSEEIRILIRVEDGVLRLIPWHLWDILNSYPKAEVALSTLTYEKNGRSASTISSDRVRILAVLGNSNGIDVHTDRQLLENLSDAEIIFLVEPEKQQLFEHLWQGNWDIIFFAGHSKTVDKQGIICLNQEDSISISDLKYGLKKSISQGLKLFIANSCDGLGIAQSLADLQIPQVIVMREPVPDFIAHEFLKQFLEGFSTGKSLYIAVREARERLQGLESKYPCASWLPIIVQNPAEIPPTWQDLCPMTFASKLFTQPRANNQYLNISPTRAEAWNNWRNRYHDLEIDFTKNDLTINLKGLNLRGANFSKVNLIGVDFSGADISDIDFSYANLAETNLTAVQALNTNFEGAILTGACLEDWNINSQANLENVICDYIYLKKIYSKEENKYVFIDRRPHDPNKIFAPGEFSKLYQKAFETIDLFFLNGIDWQAFAYSLNNLQVLNGDNPLTIQKIENKGDKNILISVIVPENVNKGKIEGDFWQAYKFAQKTLENQYQARIEDKNKEIDRLFNLVQQQMTNIPNLLKSFPQKNMNFHGNVGVLENSGTLETGIEVKGSSNTNINNYVQEEKQTLAEAAAEIQQLLKQLEMSHPTNTTREKMLLASEVIDQIEANPTLKERTIAALKASSVEAFAQSLNHPVASLVTSVLEGWLRNEKG